MKRKSFLESNFRTVAMCLAVACSTIASWADPVVGGTFTYEGIQYTVRELGVGNVDGNVSVTIPQTLTGDVKIPAQVVMTEESGTVGKEWTFDVKEFDLSQMTISDNIKSLTVDNPDYSISIPNNCFQKKSIKTISISGDVSYLGTGAFEKCTSLTSVTFGENSTITEIPNRCFAECTSLSSLTIPSTVTSIGEAAFYKTQALSSLSIPRGVTSIGYAAFNMSHISSISLPEGMTAIAEATFNACTYLTDVTIPSTVASIGYDAFFACGNLKTVTCLGTTPPVCDNLAFDSVDVSKCVLMVPDSSVNSYKSADVWKNFGTVSDVEAINIDDNVVEVERYNVNGEKLSAPQVGVNIVKMSDGTVKKVVVSE